jgi:hypothetical protein
MPLKDLCKKIEGAATSPSFASVIGFDAFIDTLIQAVDKRSGPNTFVPMKVMNDFAERIFDSAGRSCNIELVPGEAQLGGNAPLMAQGLVHLGSNINLIGVLGEPEIAAPFRPLTNLCKEVYSLGNPSTTDALEFTDGKILLGKMESVLQLDVELLLQKVGKEQLERLLDNCTLLATTNWTMCAHLTEIWNYLADEILPLLGKEKTRWFFIDLADPRKRSKQDLKQALEVLKKFQPSFKVVLGLNASEAMQVLELYGLKEDSLEKAARLIQEKAGLDQIVLHTKQETAAASKENHALIKVPYCEKPKKLTGAGDTFNAGYMWGTVHGFTLQESLYTAIASAGHYIREATPATPKEVISFLKKIPPSI